MDHPEPTDGVQPLDHITAMVRAAGIKLTAQRLEIFREIATTVDHPDAETLLRAVQKRMPTISLDTVYRTLWMLHDLGLVNTLGPRRDGLRFDANLEHHHHFVCMRCGLVRDFSSPELESLPIPDSVRELGSIITAHVEVRGLCDSCKHQPTEPHPSGNR